MVHDSKTAKTASATDDIEAISQQLTALREEMTKLGETVSGIAGRRGSNLATDIAEGFDEARHYAERKGRSAEDQLEASVAAHPFVTIGLAVATGFLVGTLSRR
ncbi:hypothetical protein M8756_04660 [Lutimaribacter sp. EGI FJ00015]|uniref:Uncharacterized protein n=1 Tax=Lutimaribacter degradans TaxID=2945989 RepID=A0ACC5ZTM3_9RHOB|nr:hypothetical protein [Lutimaribacter sp. EGI FJ00013]MCM2561698.1 hypothetical protein [Lutimaribacter sp. EGI FJ00013]MCO0612589.1 hypothetical protein [Lutimaribacter sp. EGI FJ00015]MCO0635248.1 hypothetical protein [Lutimaribacter sp. EGI FJ00014]